MPDQKKPKEQNPILWLLGQKESDEQRKTREAREAQEKRNRAVVEAAVRKGVLPKVGQKKPESGKK